MQYAAIVQLLSKNLKWVLLIGGSVLLYNAGKPLWYRLFGQVPEDAPYKKGGGDVTAAFASNVGNKVQQIRKGIQDDSVFGSDLRCNTLNEIIYYNDNELRMIHNQYKNKYGITLYGDLNNISGDGCANLFSQEAHIALKNKLGKLSLV